MAVIGVADQYMILIAITLLFTVFGLIEEINLKKIILQSISGILWFVSGFAYFLVGDSTSILTVAPTYIFAGLGLIFILSALNDAIHSVKGTP